jgi:acylphosphatase
MPTVHLIIKGKVQGVFYRASAREKAEETGVSGWVKNTAAGDVEITASGPGKNLQEFITWCRQGPPNAVVTDIRIHDLPELRFDGFKILR